jgi:hypothetical protein
MAAARRVSRITSFLSLLLCAGFRTELSSDFGKTPLYGIITPGCRRLIKGMAVDRWDVERAAKEATD